MDPPALPDLPQWLQELWLGWSGREHGEEGLVRSAARKYSRHIQTALSMASQTSKERQFGTGGSQSSWSPSVVIEGRISRRMGSITSDREPRFAAMYVHDAMFGHEDVAEMPEVVKTSHGRRVVLPPSTTGPEKRRVAQLFEQLYDYVRGVNEYVRQLVCAAEELQNMGDEDVQHTVLLLRGKRSSNDQRQAQVPRSPFASNAGHHGHMRGLPEVCVLCPRTYAHDEKSTVIYCGRYILRWTLSST